MIQLKHVEKTRDGETCGCMSIVLASRRLKDKGHKFKVSYGCLVSSIPTFTTVSQKERRHEQALQN